MSSNQLTTDPSAGVLSPSAQNFDASASLTRLDTRAPDAELSVNFRSAYSARAAQSISISRSQQLSRQVMAKPGERLVRDTGRRRAIAVSTGKNT